MKFNYYEKESKVYDLLQFPRLLYVTKEQSEDEKSLLPINLLNNNDHIKMIEEINSKLKPFKEEINAFYADEFISNYDLFILLTDMYPFFGFESVDAYLDSIVSLDETRIKKDLVLALLDIESDDAEKESLKDKRQELMNKQGDLMQFIKELPTQSSYKWNILMVLENPHKMIGQFRTLLKQLEPMYDEYYQTYKQDIDECKNMLLKAVEEDPRESFIAITKNMVKDNYLKEENKILVSFLFAYSFFTRDTNHESFFIWGTKMEDGFEMISKMHGDRMEKTAKVFKILGDKTRYEVLKLIANGTFSTKVIANQLGVTSATISYHINSFVTNHVIKLNPDSKRKYDVNFEMLNELWGNFISDLKQEEE